MRYLVDANVLSEPTKVRPDAGVVAWFAQHEGNLVVDPIVLGEIRVGILLLPRGRKRVRLQQWLDRVEETIECLPWDQGVSHCWAELVAELRRKGRALPLLDSMIAATALRHELTVVTRNVRDFQQAGVAVIDPFAPTSAFPG